MNDITVEEREENKRKVSQKYEAANGHKGHKRSQIVAKGRK